MPGEDIRTGVADRLAVPQTGPEQPRPMRPGGQDEPARVCISLSNLLKDTAYLATNGFGSLLTGAVGEIFSGTHFRFSREGPNTKLQRKRITWPG
jgi:hypothetical protein